MQPGAVKGRILCLGAERKIARIFYVLRPVCIKLGTGYTQEALLSDYEFRENRMIACSNFLGGGGVNQFLCVLATHARFERNSVLEYARDCVQRLSFSKIGAGKVESG